MTLRRLLGRVLRIVRDRADSAQYAIDRAYSTALMAEVERRAPAAPPVPTALAPLPMPCVCEVAMQSYEAVRRMGYETVSPPFGPWVQAQLCKCHTHKGAMQ